MPEVAEGEEQFLFALSESNGFVDQLVGRRNISDSFVDKLLLLQIQRYATCKAFGVSYYWFLCPAKERVLYEYLPPQTRAAVDLDRSIARRIFVRAKSLGCEQLLRHFYCDLADSFADVERARLFHRTDTHWTHFGAHLAYRFCVEKVVTPSIGAAQMQVRATAAKQQGDLGRILNLPPEDIVHFANPNMTSKRVFFNGVENNGKFEIFVSGQLEKSTALIIRSSSIDFMKEFFVDHFRKAVLLFCPDLNYELVVRERPDYVFHFQQERYLTRLPEDAQAQFMTSTLKEKGAFQDTVSKLAEYVSSGGSLIRDEARFDTLRIFEEGRI